MLPFLQAWMLVNSALDDRQLPDQCWMEQDQIKLSGARCDASALSVAVPWQMGHTGPKGYTVVHGRISKYNMAKEITTIATDAVYLSSGWSVCRQASSLDIQVLLEIWHNWWSQKCLSSPISKKEAADITNHSRSYKTDCELLSVFCSNQAPIFTISEVQWDLKAQRSKVVFSLLSSKGLSSCGA